MKQDSFYCWNHREEYPYEVWFFTEKQKSEKVRFFRSIEEVRAWARKHKTARIKYASWQVFEIMDEVRRAA